MLTSENMGPADIAAVTGNNGNDGLFGGNGAWFLIILFLFAFMGWGGNWGGAAASGGSVAPNYTLASDFATIQRQLSDGFGAMERKGDSINNGLCDGFYAQNSTMLNGFAGVNQTLNTQGFETRNAITQAQIAQMQSANTLQAQLAQCCCDNRTATSDLKYTIATTGNGIERQAERGFADLGYANSANTTAIINNAHGDADRILAKLNDMEATRQQERIAALQSENQALRFEASQANQNTYLVNQLKPCPIPAYNVPNPNCCYQQTCGCA